MAKEQLNSLEHQVDQLIYHCTQLEQENAGLRAKESGWIKERDKLIEKNDIARTRVEAMIERLRALETQS